MRKKFVSKLGFESQIPGFTHQRLNQLDHWDTYTNSETNLSIIHISIQDSQYLILYYNSYLRATNKWVFCLELLYILIRLTSPKWRYYCKFHISIYVHMIRLQIVREKFVSKLGFEPQIPGFTHRHLNQLMSFRTS